jgi:hypothetical protein
VNTFVPPTEKTPDVVYTTPSAHAGTTAVSSPPTKNIEAIATELNLFIELTLLLCTATYCSNDYKVPQEVLQEANYPHGEKDLD